jgi:hypothetical protein
MSANEPTSKNNPGRRKILIWGASIVVAITALVGSLYAIFVPGLSSALREPVPTANQARAYW